MEQPESENLKIQNFLKMAASTWQAYNFVKNMNSENTNIYENVDI